MPSVSFTACSKPTKIALEIIAEEPAVNSKLENAKVQADNLVLGKKDEEKEIVEKKVQKVNNNPKPIKMTFNEKKEFETIMDDITKLEEEIESLDNKINSSYMNYSLVKDDMVLKEQLEKELEKKIERWEYLSNIDSMTKK